jgi:hypothetical protein
VRILPLNYTRMFCEAQINADCGSLQLLTPFYY